MTRNQELIEEAKKRGYTHNNFKCLNKSYKRTSIESLDRWYYNELEDTLFTNTRMNGGKAVYRNGIWADFIETLQEKAIRLENELKEVKRQIEEENKPKVGDLCKFWNDSKNSFIIGVLQIIHPGCKHKYETIYDCQFPNCEKITNPELINKLNELIK